jgi:hypothetical protein
MKTMQWGRGRTIGCLLILWHDSQEKLAITASKEQILDWLDLEESEDPERFFDALVRHAYLRKTEQANVFRISGNQKHVDAHQSRIVSAREAGKASGKSRKNNDFERNRTTRSKKEHNSIQFNAVQYNSKQEEKEKKPLEKIHPLAETHPAQEALELETASPPVPTARGNPVGFLIGTYVQAWQRRYSTKARPDVGGKSQGILKRILAQCPVQTVANLLQVYCQMKDPWFEKQRHNLVTFEAQFNAVALALDHGEEKGTYDWAKVFKEVPSEERALPRPG